MEPAAAQPNAGAAAIGATGSTGTLRGDGVTVEWRVLNDGAALRPASPPQAPDVRRDVTAPCGPSRACAASADLRLLAIETYGQAVTAPFRLVADVQVENRGRTRSAASEVVLCDGSDRQRCDAGSLDSFEIPALAPGERITVRRKLDPTGVPASGSSLDLLAVVDQDRHAPDANRANNARRVSVPVEHPTVEFQEFRVPPAEVAYSDRSKPLEVLLRVRNASRTAPTGAVRLSHEFNAPSEHRCVSQYASTRLEVPLPDMPAKSVVEYRVLLPAYFAGCARPRPDDPNPTTIFGTFGETHAAAANPEFSRASEVTYQSKLTPR